MAIRLPGGSASVALATPSTNGLMPATDKAKVDALGTAATHAVGDFALVGDPAAAVSTHDGNTGAHGQTAAGRALLTAANVAAQMTALGAAPLASPTFTGPVNVPTPTAGNNSTLAATTAFVATAISALVASSPAALDTLNELAAALGNDANFAATVTAALAAKAPIASPTFTGNPAAPTAATATNTTQIATTAFVQSVVATYAEVAPGRAKSASTTYWHLPGVEATSISTAGPGANTVRYGMILVDTQITIDGLMCEVATAGSSGNTARLGIYNADLSWQPTSLVVDSGAFAVTSTGVKINSISATVLPPGRYLTAIHTDSSGLACRAARGGVRYTGYDPGMGVNAFIAGVTISRGSYSALPTTGLAWDTSSGSSAPLAQMVFLRISAP